MSEVGETDSLDTSDVDKYVGQMIGGGQLKEPISVTDIRRWVQAMHYPNPRHFDEEAAHETPFGQIIAPQSFVASTENHGMIPAVVGVIPNSHVLFGGGEWWFYGPRVMPGDRIRTDRRFDGYTIAETRFAGPTMFSRGDNWYLNQRKEIVAKHRAVAVRYLPEIARSRGFYDQNAGEAPIWTSQQLADVKQQQTKWLQSGADGEGPGHVRVGDSLATRPIGPHTATSFANEFQGFLSTVWGTQLMEGTAYWRNAGWLPEMGTTTSDNYDRLDEGPASGHTNLHKAKLIGIPRHYGYGSSIGIWALDWLAYWAGDRGFVRHIKLDYRFPVFDGDVSLLKGEVTDVRSEPLLGLRLAAIQVTMTNQDGVVIARGDAEAELPEY